MVAKFSNVKRKIVGFIIEYRKMKLKELKGHESSLEVIDVAERSPFSIRMLWAISLHDGDPDDIVISTNWSYSLFSVRSQKCQLAQKVCSVICCIKKLYQEISWTNPFPTAKKDSSQKPESLNFQPPRQINLKFNLSQFSRQVFSI